MSGAGAGAFHSAEPDPAGHDHRDELLGDAAARHGEQLALGALHAPTGQCCCLFYVVY